MQINVMDIRKERKHFYSWIEESLRVYAPQLIHRDEKELDVKELMTWAVSR